MVFSRNTVIAISALSMAFALWTSPALAEPVPADFDWKAFMDLIEEDSDTIVGEEMC